MGAELLSFTVHVDTGRWSATVVDAVDLVVPEGRITALMGGPGSGKSMVLGALTGRLPATATVSGQVCVNGSGVASELAWQELRGAVVGHAPQDAVTAFAATATIGDQLHAIEHTHRQWQLERACAAAGFPSEKLELFPHQLSGGEAKRAALAAAMLPAPPVLLVDEPTASLDHELKHAVWATLRAYADDGGSVLAVTNDVAILADTHVADHFALMGDGRITAQGNRIDDVGWAGATH